MNQEENSKLISELYNAEKRQEIADILEYMGESGDSVFVYPMLDGYRKFKHSSIGYYFIWNLSRLDYRETGRRLNELLENYEIQKEHIPIALFFMAERRFFSDIAKKMAAMYLDHCDNPEFRQDFELNALGMACILDYLYESDSLEKFEYRLRGLIFSDNIKKDEKAVMISFLLESHQEKQIDFLADNYAKKIRNTPMEANLVRKMLFCQAENVKNLKNIIIKDSQGEAVQILEKHDLPLGRKGSQKPVYNCVDVVIKIAIMRERINKMVSENRQVGFEIFPDSELLIHQAQSVDDKGIFLQAVADLLAIIRSVNPQVRNHGIDGKEVEGILSGIPAGKNNLDLSHFFLYLNAKGIGVDYNFFGLKQLDYTLEVILEDRGNGEFFEKLENIGIAGMYHRKEWHKIHGYLLNSYLQSLDMLNKAFGQYDKQDLENDN